MNTTETLSPPGRAVRADVPGCPASSLVDLSEQFGREAGVALRFYGPDGSPLERTQGGGVKRKDVPGDDRGGWPDEGPAARRLTELVRRVAGGGPDGLESVGGHWVAVFPIRRRDQVVLIGAASCGAQGEEAGTWGRRLLGAVARGIQARVAGATATEGNEAATEALLQSYEEVSLLHDLGEFLLVSRPVAELIKHVCGELREISAAEAAAAYLPAVEDVESGTVVAGRLPFGAEQLPRLIDYLLEGLGREQSLVVNNHCQDDPELARVSTALRNVVLVALPLRDGPRGGILVVNSKGGEFGSAEAKLVRSITGSTAVFTENHRLYRELRQMMLDLVRSLVSSIDAKDPYTCGHSERVAITSREIARRLDLDRDRVEWAYLAGLLHDIGKIGTPENILRKEGELEIEERRTMALHTTVGGRILAGIKTLEHVRDAVLHHHEHLDGRGYPDGLQGEQIPLLARIVGLADAFDAMTSNRPYRPMLSLERVRREIESHSGTQFDVRVVDALFSMDLVHLMQKLAEPSTFHAEMAI